MIIFEIIILPDKQLNTRTMTSYLFVILNHVLFETDIEVDDYKIVNF